MEPQGVSHPVSSEDLGNASKYPQINHWVIGCGAIAQYDSSNKNYFNLSTGNISTICNDLNK